MTADRRGRSLTEIKRRLALLERAVGRKLPADTPVEKYPHTGLSVREILRGGGDFIGWGWYPNPEEIEAIRGGALVCFTESTTGAAFVTVEGVEPRPLPAFRETEAKQTNKQVAS